MNKSVDLFDLNLMCDATFLSQKCNISQGSWRELRRGTLHDSACVSIYLGFRGFKHSIRYSLTPLSSTEAYFVLL